MAQTALNSSRKAAPKYTMYEMSSAAVNPFAGLPTIFAVLGKLGLELKRQEDILPVYTAERIEHPAGN